MRNISSTIQDFFDKIGRVDELDVRPVPKSDSCAVPGDFVLFRYRTDKKMRIVLVTQPVTKEPKTGNLLLTGFTVPVDGRYSRKELANLYKDKGLPQDSYRTYRMNRIIGQLRKFNLVDTDEQ